MVADEGHEGRQNAMQRLMPIDQMQVSAASYRDQLQDLAIAAVEDLSCRTLVFGIQTVPAFDLRDLPPNIAETLTSFKRRKSEPAAIDAESKKLMSLNPFFGKVISLALADGDAGAGHDAVTVLAVPPDGQAIPDCPRWLRLMTEQDLLRAFWALASRAETCVSFFGRGFDVPFLVTRSLIHGIPARVDLVSMSQDPDVVSLRPHLDLHEVLTHHRLGTSNLDVVLWALGLNNPKEMTDRSMVAPANGRGEIVKIAELSAHDVKAKSAIYRQVRDHLLRYRADWK